MGLQGLEFRVFGVEGSGNPSLPISRCRNLQTFQSRRQKAAVSQCPPEFGGGRGEGLATGLPGWGCGFLYSKAGASSFGILGFTFRLAADVLHQHHGCGPSLCRSGPKLSYAIDPSLGRVIIVCLYRGMFFVLLSA